MKELESLSLEFKVVDEKNLHGTRVSLKKDLGLCVLGLFLLWVSFSVHTQWNSSLYTWIIYLHHLGTRVSKARDTSLLKSFKNMPTNEIVAKIMIKWKICSILER